MNDLVVSHLLMWVGGLMIGVGIGVVMEKKVTNSIIQECEKDLPRTQTCVLVAVPKKDQ